MNKKISILTFLCAGTLFYCVHAQNLEPRSYSVSPVGLHALAASYTYSHGNIISGFKSPIQNLVLNTSVIVPVYVQTFPFFGKLARIQAAAPFVFLNGSASLNHVDTVGSRAGFADALIKFGVNLIGSPILHPKEFRAFQEATVLGASLVISVPTGQYFNDKIINIGTNRWGIKPELGFSHRDGRFFFEAYSGVWFFTENTAFLKTKTISQKPLLTFQAHVDYVFKSSMWVAVNGGFGLGGESAVNNIEQGNSEGNFRAGITFSMPISKKQSVKLALNTGVTTRAGQNYSAVSIAYQYIWF